MNTDKPKILWHADGEGRCHAGCEAFSPADTNAAGGPCNAVGVLPWHVRRNRWVGTPCPFAVLADVLALHKRQPDEERTCGTCAEYSSSINTCSFTGQAEDDSGPPWPNCRFWGPR